MMLDVGWLPKPKRCVTNAHPHHVAVCKLSFSLGQASADVRGPECLVHALNCWSGWQTLQERCSLE